jgi:hypothetical protein
MGRNDVLRGVVGMKSIDTELWQIRTKRPRWKSEILNRGKMKLKTFHPLRLLTCLAFISLPVAGGLLPGPSTMAALQKQSEVIAQATLPSIDDSQGFEMVQLHVSRVRLIPPFL